jgi:hypothetical protein
VGTGPRVARVELQLTIDCQDPSAMVAFWGPALEYEPQPAPEGFGTWREWYLSIGVPASELGDGDAQDRLRDPSGRGPRIWFQPVPEAKSVKNRLHLDLHVGGGRAVPIEERRPLVDAKVAELLAAGATQVHVLDGYDGHYAVSLRDPEGNEFCVL